MTNNLEFLESFSPTGDNVNEFTSQMLEEVGTIRSFQMGTATGLPVLDKTIRGLTPGKLYVVGGRTGAGKTSFATTITANILNMAKQPVLYISTELDFVEIWKQVTEAYKGGIPFHPTERQVPPVVDQMKKSISSTAALLSRGEFSIVTKKKLSEGFIKNCIDYHCDVLNGGSASVVIVDQMSRISRPDKSGHGYAIATEHLMNTMEEVADINDVPLVLLSQLNRGAAGEKPSLKHFKHSGSIEEMAHCAILLDKGDFIYGSGGLHDSEIIVAKNRHGPEKVITARFNGPGHTWTEHEIYKREDD